MDNRNNTIAGWVLFAGICALGLSIGSGMLNASHNPEKPGFPIEDAEAGAGGGESAVPLANLLAAADPAKGETVFAKCAACHTVNSGGANGIGPNLFGTLGEEIGHGKHGFAFSSALAGMGGSWDFEKMDKWLTSPRKFAPGTKMSFAGLSNAEDRANLIVYLNAQGSNLPLPAPEAAPAADAAAAPAEGAAPADTAAAAPADAAKGAAPAEAPAAPAPAEAKK
ncbi:cytochrome c family protein [Sphingopyxis sp. GW247-27LB]|uniref:c-type cytochrome n=1 Tax=Sphingopyxis sp. GW247-27LB TaxID=2012632 RepID=UPI000BA71AD4|nr:cytochrome c family protein [Sphingopyxis sp. GW247-27LB]PAL22543.1 cytochrome c family protein [Sphingopyxis sp. GW247-27LB]